MMETTIHMETGKPYAHVKILNDDTSVQEKDVPLQALAAVFQEKEEQLYILPNNLFSEYQPDTHIDGLLLGCESSFRTTGLFFVPAQKFYMDVAGEKSMMPYPSLLFLLTESGGTLRSSMCFTVKEKSVDKLRPESVIYAFPFGNVLASDGHICWGANEMTKHEGYQGLRSAIALFLTAESNMDYVSYGESYKGKIKTYPTLLASLKKKDVFPDNILVPSPAFKTFKELCETII